MTTIRPRKSPSPEAFVRAWSRARSCAQAAARLGMSVNAAKARASLYRKAGVALKRMPARARLDVKGLNALAQRR